jgi:putative sigma-54 modulation protein
MMKISVQSEHFRADSKLIDYVEKKLIRLQRVFQPLLTAEVHLKLQDTGARVQQKIVDIRLRLPGGTLLDRKSATTFEAAVDASLDTLKRQLVRHKEKGNGTVREVPLTSEEPREEIIPEELTEE